MKSAQEEQRPQEDRPSHRLGEAHHHELRQVLEVPGAGHEHFQYRFEYDGVRGLEVKLTYLIRRGQFMLEASKRTQDWLKENLPEVWDKEVLPPSSPNCNHLDYFVQGVSEL
jgi:hypothetical protein